MSYIYLIKNYDILTFLCIKDFHQNSLIHVLIRVIMLRMEEIMKTAELIKILKKNGCFFVEQGKEHDKCHSTTSVCESGVGC